MIHTSWATFFSHLGITHILQAVLISSFRIRFVTNPVALARQKHPIFTGGVFYGFFVTEVYVSAE